MLQPSKVGVLSFGVLIAALGGFDVADQHHVGTGVPMLHYELLSIRRPGELADVITFEVCQLMARSAVEGLFPDVIHIILSNRIRYRFAARNERECSPCDPRIKIEHPYRRTGISIDKRKLASTFSSLRSNRDCFVRRARCLESRQSPNC